MKAREIHGFFQKLGTWIDWSNTVDGFRCGNPETEVTGITVGWKPYWSDLRRTVELGCNLFIAHESIFRDGPMREGDEIATAIALEQPKANWLRESGLVVYRCHDVCDMLPGIGVRDSWAKGLGLGDTPLVEHGFCLLEDVTGHTFGSLCAQVAERLKEIGQNAILACGEANQPVTKLALASGANTIEEMLGLGADVWLGYDDYFRQVRDGAMLRDLGIPFIIVNHGTLEEWGVRNLADLLRKQFPNLPVHHLPQGCIYRAISAG